MKNEISDNGTVYTPEQIRNMMYGLDALVELDDKRMVPAINLDNAATTPAFKEVVNDIQEKLLYYGSIGRGKGQKSEHSSRIYEDGRAIVKDFVGASSDEYTVFYTNCATDGMNKLASALIEDPEYMVLTTRMEHHANDLPWRERAKTIHAEVDELGRLLLSDLKRLLEENSGRIKFVSVTAASNVTGYVNDVHAIARLAHQHGAQIIVDGAQIVAHRAFSMLGESPEENIDYFVFSAHKMYSPFGGGAVVGRADVLNRRIPQFYGGGMVKTVYDERVVYTGPPDLYEAGSPNYPGVVGMLKAMEILKRIGFDYVVAHEQRLMNRALVELKKIEKVILYGDNAHIADRVGILVFNLDGIENGEVANRLAGHSAIAVRHAAFCAHTYVRRLTGEPEPKQTNNPSNACFPPGGMIRVSFGIYNSDEEVDAFLKTIRELLEEGHPMAFSTDRGDASLAGTGLVLPNDRG